MRKDVEFLRSKGLMDYSLLLGIETVPFENDRSSLTERAS